MDLQTRFTKSLALLRLGGRRRQAVQPVIYDELPEVQKVLVVISDGVDTDPPGPSRRQAIETCQRAETSIYSISISTSTDWLAISGDKPKKIHKTRGDEELEIMA